MTTKDIALFSLFISLSLLSCQKQLLLEDVEPAPGGNNNSLTGEYTMVNFQVKATSTGTYTEAGLQVKSVTYTDYTTKNNQGVIVVDDSQFHSNNVSYSVDTTVNAFFYIGGALLDSVDAPFAIDMPAYTTSSPYSKVGTDSLTFTNGFIDLPSGTGIPVQNSASGAKYSWSGDTLILRTSFSISNTKVIDGTPVNLLYKGSQWTRLKKK